MRKEQKNNYAFIDATNLYKSIETAGWKLNYKRFRIWLRDKYKVSKAYIFIGMIEGDHKLYALYRDLQNWGYTIIFKPTIPQKDGERKGNCDGEMILQAAAVDIQEYDKAILVTGDGDFYCLVEYLLNNDKLDRIICPTLEKSSKLLRDSGAKIVFLDELRQKLEYK